ncbi:SBBP repeat-containing protein [Paenibacillus sp. NEAU-GSW1]|uniref:SBBP repeat-containing protein n=1 Tax=Paenibacillus sp. NEAU-GSW1 TaxID=2682486 RepID=UPI0012E1198A|nr:SBBP repeat-containing protein [Paenibacillus sp. NEAU-GSW1]MUT67491.1 DUF11 domain-containing protein [Paenibacillus sp. NEAU-GSW1]
MHANQTLQALGENMRLLFIRNDGQSPLASVLYAQGNRFKLSAQPDQLLIHLLANDPSEHDDRVCGTTLAWRFVGASPDVRVNGMEEEPTAFHFFREKTYTGVPAFRSAAWSEVWPGIGLIVRGEEGQLKFDWHVAPGSAPERIRFRCEGSEGFRLDEEGNLLLDTAVGIMTDRKPLAYQNLDGVRKEVGCRYELTDTQDGCCELSFVMTEPYDASLPLVIDPILSYSTYLGGSLDDYGSGIAVQRWNGEAYIVGTTSSLNFPTTPGAFQTSLAGGGSQDAFVSKLSPEGSWLIYSTYIGGVDASSGIAIAVDDYGNAYITGSTSSSDFPVTTGAFQTSFGGGTNTAFVAKLNWSGSGFEYATYLGGTGASIGKGIAVDGSGNAYVTGYTDEADFPVTSGAFQQTNAGGTSAFIARLNSSGSALDYSTYVGGTANDYANAIDVSYFGDAYVTGYTLSADFPTTPGAFQTSFGGGEAGEAEPGDAFVLRLDQSGSALVYSTFLGGSRADFGNGIAVDDGGYAYVTGKTSSPDFPVGGGAFQPFLRGIANAFVTKLDPSGTGIVYSTYLGGSNSDGGNGIAVNLNGNVHVTGVTESHDFPLFDPIEGGFPGLQSAFVTTIGYYGYLEFSTFLGGDHTFGSGIAVDEQGNIYATGQTNSYGFPITPGAYQPYNAGQIDAFAVKISGEAKLDIHKFADRFDVLPGELVHFIIDLKNFGSVEITNIVIEDPLVGYFNVLPFIPPFSSQEIVLAFVVPPDAPPGPIVNQVFVRADQIRDPLVAEAVIFVNAVMILNAVKSVSPQAARPGETVVFRIELHNRSNVDLINIRLFDPLIGLDQTIAVLHVGMDIVIDWPYVIPLDARAGLTIVNFVEITADNLPNPEQIGTVVEVLPAPRLAITKIADRTVATPGETINYVVTVSNTGNSVVTDIVVTDDLTSLSVTIPSLDVDKTEVINVQLLVPLQTPPRTYSNTVIAISNEAPAVSADFEVEVAAVPLLGIRKTPDRESVSPGQTLNYTIVLENIGNVPITGIQITDELLQYAAPASDLAVGEAREMIIPYTVPLDAIIGSQIINLLTVESAQLGAQEVESTVDVVGFGLSLLKTADRVVAAPGETITYTLILQNVLATDQTNVIISDPLLAISETVPILPAGATITRTGTFTVPAGAADGSVIVNTFTAVSDQTVLQRYETEVVVQITPGETTTLAVHKLADRNEAAPRETIDYSVAVTNTGRFVATNVVVNDSLLGTQFAISAIAPGRTKIVKFSYTIPAGTKQGTVVANRVSVTWTERPPGMLPIQSEARVVVSLPSSLLDVNVSANPETAPPGNTVQKTITLENITDRTFTNVHVIDLLLRFSEIIPSLGPGQRQVFTLPFVIPAQAEGGAVFRNNVAVFSDQTALQQQAVLITAETQPDAILTQAVNQPEGSPGETVVFTIRVKNTGNVPLVNGQLTGDLLNIRLTTEVFDLNADEIIRVPFVLPEVEEDTVLTSTVFAVSDNGPPRQVSVSVRVITDEE